MFTFHTVEITESTGTTFLLYVHLSGEHKNFVIKTLNLPQKLIKNLYYRKFLRLVNI